jgi:hypothetical protein
MTRSQRSMRLSLDPDALHLASRAYDAALQSLGEGTSTIGAYAVRLLEYVGRGEANIEVLMRLAFVMRRSPGQGRARGRPLRAGAGEARSFCRTR